MGYHLRNISKGTYGKLSKIQEEIEEMEDAEIQNNKIMILVELSDVIGAIKGYLEYNFPNISLDDVIKMSEATHSAFLDGTRQ